MHYVSAAQGRLGRMIASLFATPMAAVMNLIALAAFLAIAVPLVNWALFDAVWSGDSGAACPTGSGACWAFIKSKMRLILFGRFPYDEQWRALAGTLILISLVAASLNPLLWSWRLMVGWAVGLVAYVTLMLGGVFGMSYVETSEWGGLPLTVLLTVFGVGFGLVIAIPVALARFSTLPVFRLAATVYVEAVRGVPLISVLFMASVLLPLVLPDGLTPQGLGRVMIGIVFFFAAYMAEVLRGGLQSIPRGQFEACRSLGVRYAPMMFKVVLPQAFEVVLPAMVNLTIGALKGTSLVVIVAMMDLLGAAQASLADPNWIGFYVEAYVFAAVIYALMCGTISWYGRRVERGLRAARQHSNNDKN
ncbi:amino acid ABC transporter permease [Rhodobacteraceae bacterium NNCM2]|nr:amino acid ABC transporter permease [Coraliihabitans acroporae]